MTSCDTSDCDTAGCHDDCCCSSMSVTQADTARLTRPLTLLLVLLLVIRSASSSSSDDETDAAAVPKAPTDVRAVDVRTVSVTLTWTSQSSPAVWYFVVQYRRKFTARFKDFYELSWTGNAQVLGLSPSIDYEFRVVAVSVTGRRSVPSHSLEVTTKKLRRVVPRKPRKLVVDKSERDAEGLYSVSLSWRSDTPDVDRSVDGWYIILYSHRDNLHNETVEVIGTSKFKVTGLSGDVSNYEFYVSECGTDACSRPAYFDVAAADDDDRQTRGLSAPWNLRTSDVEPFSIKLVWNSDNTEPNVRYWIMCRRKPDVYHELPRAVKAQYITVDELLPSTEYEFRVVADNGLSRSSPSRPVAVTTADIQEVLKPPQNIAISNAKKTSFTLSWQPGSKTPVDYYVIEVSRDYGQFKYFNISHDTSVLVYQLDAAIYYEFRVRSVIRGENTPPSATVSHGVKTSRRQWTSSDKRETATYDVGNTAYWSVVVLSVVVIGAGFWFVCSRSSSRLPSTQRHVTWPIRARLEYVSDDEDNAAVRAPQQLRDFHQPAAVWYPLGQPDDIHRPFALTHIERQRHLDQLIYMLMQQRNAEAHVGASDDVIQRLTSFPATQELVDSEQNCTICLESFKTAEMLHQLTCSHYFHVVCITAWLRRSASCPNCRQSL